MALAEGIDTSFINFDVIVSKVCLGMYSGNPFLSLFTHTCVSIGITTSELDILSAETCAYMNIVHPSYSRLAAKISVNNLHKSTHDDYAKVCEDLRNHTDRTGRPAPLLADDVY